MERQETYRLTREELDRERREAARYGAEVVLDRLEQQHATVRRLLAAIGGKVDKSMLCDIYGLSRSSIDRWLSRIGAEAVPGPTTDRHWYEFREVVRLDQEHGAQASQT